MAYHLNQWDNQKESTKAFMTFLDSNIKKSKVILDIGSGAGAALSHFATHYPSLQFEGLEPNLSLVRIGNQLIAERRIANLKMFQGDFSNLSASKRRPDGVISMNTLSHLEDCLAPIEEVIEKLKPDWIGMIVYFLPAI
jgi:tRNA G46 methylase TrmB